jgi:hypothetical protein
MSWREFPVTSAEDVTRRIELEAVIRAEAAVRAKAAERGAPGVPHYVSGSPEERAYRDAERAAAEGLAVAPGLPVLGRDVTLGPPGLDWPPRGEHLVILTVLEVYRGYDWGEVTVLARDDYGRQAYLAPGGMGGLYWHRICGWTGTWSGLPCRHHPDGGWGHWPDACSRHWEDASRDAVARLTAEIAAMSPRAASDVLDAAEAALKRKAAADRAAMRAIMKANRNEEGR